MIKNAKVNYSAVHNFKEAVAEIRDYSSKFDQGIYCLEKLQVSMNNAVSRLNKALLQAQMADKKLLAKIGVIEAEIAALEVEKGGLVLELSTIAPLALVKKELADLASELKAKISELNSKIRFKRDKLYSVKDLKRNIDDKIREIKDAIKTLEDNISTCKHLQIELNEVKQSNNRKGTIAVENLKKIEDIVKQYQNAKMKYESSKAGTSILNPSVQFGTGTTGYSNKAFQSELESQNNYSGEEILKHQIKFDENGRVCEYDGKNFGGKYNEYKLRANQMPNTDPLRGYYEGTQAELKYIPINRTAIGVTVIEILNQYGMDGIYYRNAEPDFEPCSVAVTQISHMSENRDDYLDSNGERKLGNFTQADISLAKTWSEEGYLGKTDWTDEDIYDYRKNHRLTWHEKCDTKTMVLVRTEINAFFTHTGGCFECKTRDGASDDGGFDE